MYRKSGMALAGAYLLLVPLSASANQLADLKALLANLQAQMITLSNTPATISSGSCVTLSRTISLGSRGEHVASVQKFLIAQGLLKSDSATGYFGLQTQAAVQKWQSIRGIVSMGTPQSTGYGVLGPKTRAVLKCGASVHSTLPSTPTTPVTNSIPGGLDSSVSVSNETPSTLPATMPFAVTNITVSPPIIVIKNSEINDTAVPWSASRKIVDAPLQTITDGERFWYNHNDITTAKYAGTLENPFSTLMWNKPTDQVFIGSRAIPSNPDGTIPGYWIVSSYENSAGILAFVHTEHPYFTNGSYDTGRTRIGLAWSGDMGEHYSYLGDIIVPFGDPAKGFNIQGVPYVIKDGYFYIYFKDACDLNGYADAVARAPVASVVAAAQAGTITPWMKYQAGSWDSLGLGGTCTSITIPPNGVNHTAATYSTYTGKYYLLHSVQNWGGQNTWIRLFESSDGLTWNFVKTIVEEPGSAVEGGYQYVSIVDAGDGINGVVGQKFYVYSAKDPESQAVVYRWLVDLGGSTLETAPVANIYRWSNSTEHFYTSFAEEDAKPYGYSAEGIVFGLAATQQAGTISLYRLQKSGHLYTTKSTERVNALNNGYNDEGVIGYIFTAPATGLQPLYSWYNSKLELRFMSLYKDIEGPTVVAQGYIYEGVMGYVYAPTQ